MIIRSYRPRDARAVHRICVATGDAGEHARGILADPDLIGYVFADPYLLLQPELAFVAESDGAVVGYVVAALDFAEFYARWQLEWAPRFAGTHPAPPDGDECDADDRLRWLLHHPRLLLPADHRTYPSHLHINLLAHARGRGVGRRLLTSVLEELTRAGSPGVQLGVRTTNVSAHAFFRAVGMRRLAPDRTAAVRFGQPLGRRLTRVGENGRTTPRHL